MRILYLFFLLTFLSSCGSGSNYYSQSYAPKAPVCDAKCIEKKGIERARKVQADNDAGKSCIMPEEKYWHKIWNCDTPNDEDRYDKWYYVLAWDQEDCDMYCKKTRCEKPKRNDLPNINCLQKPSIGERISDWWGGSSNSKSSSSNKKIEIPRTKTTTCNWDFLGNWVCKTR